MLSGKRAFHGDSAAETMSAILREEPPDLSVTTRHLARPRANRPALHREEPRTALPLGARPRVRPRSVAGGLRHPACSPRGFFRWQEAPAPSGGGRRAPRRDGRCVLCHRATGGTLPPCDAAFRPRRSTGCRFQRPLCARRPDNRLQRGVSREHRSCFDVARTPKRRGRSALRARSCCRSRRTASWRSSSAHAISHASTAARWRG